MICLGNIPYKGTVMYYLKLRLLRLFSNDVQNSD